MKGEIKELYSYRELLYMISYRDIRVRYKQSIMGFLWAILMPTLIVISGVVVRYAYALAAHSQFNRADIASVAVKSLPWAFIVSSIRFGCNSLTGNRELVTKIYFPKEIFPLASVLTSLFDLVAASPALLAFLLLMRVGVSITILWAPLLFILLVAFCAGFSMIVAAGSLFFRDVKYLVEVLLTFGIFFTPVFYEVQMFGPKGKWLLLNPVAPLLDGLSACIVRHQAPDPAWIAYSATFSLAALVMGFAFFKHLEPAFAESV
jgi:lipopolysaccharide transport system permease protein